MRLASRCRSSHSASRIQLSLAAALSLLTASGRLSFHIHAAASCRPAKKILEKTGRWLECVSTPLVNVIFGVEKTAERWSTPLAHVHPPPNTMGMCGVDHLVRGLPPSPFWRRRRLRSVPKANVRLLKEPFAHCSLVEKGNCSLGSVIARPLACPLGEVSSGGCRKRSGLANGEMPFVWPRTRGTVL